jgi:hypothetical protein
VIACALCATASAFREDTESGGDAVTTWQEEFLRLSEIERTAIENWKANPNTCDAVINAKEATNALLRKYKRAGCPAHDAQMPS